MDEANSKIILKKAIRGALSLTFRRVILLAINVVTLNIVLAKILPVSTLGVFLIANSILVFFTFFSDIGLAAALIRKVKISSEDLKTTFTIQEILAVVITAILWFLAPLLTKIYNLDQSGLWLVRTLALGFLLTSLKVIPSVLMERKLSFGKLVWVEVLETIVFNGMLIWLSLANLGIFAFSWSTLARGIIGVLTIYVISPWNVSFGFSKAAAKELLSFGVPFQLNSLLALLKDRLVPLIIAGIVGSAGVGFIGQGQRIAFLPLEVMNIITRVMFPAFSRLQNDKKGLKVALENSLFATSLCLYPILFGILATAPSLVRFLGETKWGPVLPLIYLFSITAFWAALSTPMTNFLNAVGKITITLKLMIMWTVLEWALAPLFTLKFGFVGMGISSAIISLTSIIPLIIVKKITNIQILSNIWQPLLASFIMMIVVLWLSFLIPIELPVLLILIIFGALIYLCLIYILAKERFKLSVKEVINAFIS